ncbi:MAG TPA: SpoIIE family protein phosphatase [Candidatus Binatus sp.]|nr:SpoIIE family protein phosphatase [Candidatus Binatus sp.]
MNNNKQFALGAIILAMLVVAVLDKYLTGFSLAPLAFIFVIAVAAVGGLAWGLTCAVIAAPLFAFADAARPRDPLALATNAVVLLVALVSVVALVEIIRRRTAKTEEMTKDLQTERAEHGHLKALHVAQQAARRSEARYRELSESLPFGIWQVDEADRLVYMSKSYLDMIGHSLEDMQQGGFLAGMPERDAERFAEAWQARTPDKLFEADYHVRGADGKLYSILSRGVAMRDDADRAKGWIGFALDVTERRRAAEQVEFLAELSRIMSLSLDPTTTLERTAALMVPRVADWYAVDLLTDEGSVKRVLMVHSDPELTNKARALLSHAPADLSFPEGAPHVIATGRPEVYDRMPARAIANLEDDDPLNAVVAGFAFCSAIVVPLIARERTIGALTFISCDEKRQLDASDLLFAYLIERRVAVAYDNARLYAHEHEVADFLQRASLPESLPDVPGMRVRSHYMPGAQEAEIGGDWYDAFQLPDGRLGVSIGDVSGKGLQAAATMNSVRLALRAAALEGLTPSAVMTRTNQFLLNDKPTMVTAVFGVLDPLQHSFNCAIAGHPMPVVITPSGEVVSPQPMAPPLGVFHESGYPEQELPMEAGSLLVLYTDGLVEYSRRIEEGEAKLIETARLAHARGEPNAARFIAETMIKDAPSDDLAVLTVAIEAEPLHQLDLTLPALPASARLFRQALQRLYAAIGLPEERSSSMQVAVGEAIMNAIEHAYGVRGGSVRVRAGLQDGRVSVEVIDTGRWRTPRDDDRGRGLEIMSGLVDDVTVNRRREGTTINLVASLDSKR